MSRGSWAPTTVLLGLLSGCGDKAGDSGSDGGGSDGGGRDGSTDDGGTDGSTDDGGTDGGSTAMDSGEDGGTGGADTGRPAHWSNGLGLAVQLTWTVSKDDLDLHLVRGEGEVRTSDDCFYVNCEGDDGLAWGEEDVVTDNPRLVLSDLRGRGPERTTLEQPAEEQYRVVVHDHVTFTRTEDNAARVVVYSDGVEVAARAFTMPDEDYWYEALVLTFRDGELVEARPGDGLLPPT